jgi:RNA polymerase subunit RPABC4/transcription elongation factor Spt4
MKKRYCGWMSCRALVTPDMTHCPQCGVALSFEYEDEDAADQES